MARQLRAEDLRRKGLLRFVDEYDQYIDGFNNQQKDYKLVTPTQYIDTKLEPTKQELVDPVYIATERFANGAANVTQEVVDVVLGRIFK